VSERAPAGAARPPAVPRRFAIALGGNDGDVRAAFSSALAALAARFGPLEVAPLYRSEPVSARAQAEFLNTVALGSTAAAAETLLAAALEIEAALGRRRESAGSATGPGPRPIDLDLLFVGDERRASPTLVLPHPRLRERRFVLAPLADLAPELPLPPDGATAADLLRALPARPWAVRAGEPAPPARPASP
jgi:2-amino-4-hydroxy-6-hydroxymethyldihydropteridine diphosphokinase